MDGLDSITVVTKTWIFGGDGAGNKGHKKVEFMFEVCPEWVHTRKYNITTDSVGGEAVLDFMFWPSAKHRFGWYLEPSYAYNFGRGHEQSIGVSVGLLIAIP
jgi:hypothetical protein